MSNPESHRKGKRRCLTSENGEGRTLEANSLRVGAMQERGSDWLSDLMQVTPSLSGTQLPHEVQLPGGCGDGPIQNLVYLLHISGHHSCALALKSMGLLLCLGGCLP